VSAATRLLGMGMFLAATGLTAAAHGQEAAVPGDSGLPGVLRFGITDQQIDMRNYTRDDLRPVPAPRLDRLSDQVRITVTDGDPMCLPGRGVWSGPASATGHFPGVGRPR
jgi:hypothetical protein